MKKITISKLFLYRYRFVIGYVVLGLLFVGLLVTMPLYAQNGLSQAEIDSATRSYYLGRGDVSNGDLVDLPYRVLQKLAITAFGLSPYTVKLPSIVMGLLLGLLLILLLNRWFKSNVSLLASTLIILSTPFLFLAGSGTPLIMIVFWPTLLLWLGSKIQGEKQPRPLYCFMFMIALLGAIFTPYMLYFALFCVLFVLVQPHLRFVVKSLPKVPLALCILLALGGCALIGVSIHQHPETLAELLFNDSGGVEGFWNNIGLGMARMFSWRSSLEGVFLAPLLSLPSFALALIGLFSTTKGFFASRNSIASILLVFCLVITGFNPDAVIFMILPFAILMAHGLKYLLEKWYGLFPANPYARIAALLPLSILFVAMILPSLLQYFYGYRYSPNVAGEFSDSLGVMLQNREALAGRTLVAPENTLFYQILEQSMEVKVVTTTEEAAGQPLAILGTPAAEANLANYQLERIITSPKRDNSDILYLYKQESKEETDGANV